MTANLKALIGKLNATCRQATERAVSDCVSQGHYEVELEHLFLALLDNASSDFSILAKRCGVNPDTLIKDLGNEMENFKTGNTRTPVFSPHLLTLFEHAWFLASLDSEAARIRSSYLLLALLTESDLLQLALHSSRQFAKFPLHELKHQLSGMIADFPEGAEAVRLPQRESPTGQGVPDSLNAERGQSASWTKTPALDRFTNNLTQCARDGKLDPVIGRDKEIRQIINILMRRRQNNPILTGEAGVGKTAVVEGLAQRIADKDVPLSLQNVALHVLDLGLLQAGASVKGEFENRLEKVIHEVKCSPHPVILFIDEAHTMIGAGGQAGQNDAANLLKPALARGELRTIAATTWSEYKKYFEKDAALARRFQVVKVDEPTQAMACSMLRGMTKKMEAHFQVRILEEAVLDAVRLSARYISGRQLPDKAIAILDTACARVALGQSGVPAVIEDARRMETALLAETMALTKELATGSSHDERLKELQLQREANLAQLHVFEERWEKEKILVHCIQSLRAELEKADAECAQAEKTPSHSSLLTERKELIALQKSLRELQGESPLVPVCVDAQAVGEIVSAWTGIPIGRMIKDEIRMVLDLQSLLEKRVIGQSHALADIAHYVRMARANIDDPNKPKGVFLFVGPSGVGKTETAFALADILYGGERNLITLNMSEYQEAHTVSSLKGSPPGYVGYGEGGVLTEAVRRKPHSVVLLDEIEKAHPDVLELFYQVFDKGVLDDAEGREVDFKNTLIILTSNVASQLIMQACLNKSGDGLPDAASLRAIIRPALYKMFKPAFLGRMKVIPYYPLPDPILADIVSLKLQRIKSRIEANHKADFHYSDAVIDAILARCTEVDSGARNVDHILNGTMLPEIAGTVLARMAEGKPIRKVKVAVTRNSTFSYRIQ